MSSKKIQLDALREEFLSRGWPPPAEPLPTKPLTPAQLDERQRRIAEQLAARQRRIAERVQALDAQQFAWLYAALEDKALAIINQLTLLAQHAYTRTPEGEIAPLFTVDDLKGLPKPLVDSVLAVKRHFKTDTSSKGGKAKAAADKATLELKAIVKAEARRWRDFKPSPASLYPTDPSFVTGIVKIVEGKNKNYNVSVDTVADWVRDLRKTCDAPPAQRGRRRK